MSAYHVMQGFLAGLAAAAEQRSIYRKDWARRTGRAKRPPSAPIEIFIGLYSAGHSLSEIADEHGLRSETVRQRLLKAGVVMRPQGGKRENNYVVGVTSRGNASKEARIGRAN